MSIAYADTVFSVGENVVWNAVEGELVLLNASTGTYYALDEIGADIWRLLAERKQVPQVVESLLHTYEIDEHTLSVDVDRLVGELLEAKLLEAKFPVDGGQAS